MTPYKNLSHQSGVLSYEIHPHSILIEFQGHQTYLYTYEVPGREHVEAMKALAQKGRGLSTYISTRVRERYKRKIS